MKRQSVNYPFFNLPVILFLLCLVFSFVMMGRTENGSVYSWLFLLPLIHGFVILFNAKSLQKENLTWTKLFVLIGYTLRNVITPFFFVIGGFKYVGFHTIRITSEIELIKAILLMSYETIVIFFGMTYFTNRLSIRAQLEYNEYSGFDHKVNRSFPKSTGYSLVYWGIIILLFVSFILDSSIRHGYSSMWSSDAIELVTSVERDRENAVAGGLLYSFFLMFFSLMQIQICAKVVYWFSRNFKSVIFSIIGSVLFCGVFITCFVPESTILSVYLCIIMFIYIRDVFSDYKRKIDLFAGVGAVVVIFLLIYAKVVFWNPEGANIYTTISSLFNAYIPGVFSISKTWNISTPSKLITLYSDINDSLPLRSIIPNFFGAPRLVTYFNIGANTDFQIIPFISQLYYYFGILGPFIQLIFIYHSVKAEVKLKYTNNYLYFIAYVTTIVLFSFGVSTRNITNILKPFWKMILPCFILAKFSANSEPVSIQVRNFMLNKS